MPITVCCTSCNAKLNAPDKAAGKHAKCPKCGAKLAVPSSGNIAAAPLPPWMEPAQPPAAEPPSPPDAPRDRRKATFCVECDLELKPGEKFCVECGAPAGGYAGAGRQRNTKGIQLTERTSKYWKLQILISSLMVMLGMFLFCSGITDANPDKPMRTIGGWLLGPGLIWLIVAKAGAWWDHG